MKKNFLLSWCFALALICFPLVALGQETPSTFGNLPTKPNTAKMIKVADVGFEKTAIVSQDNNVFKISFELLNKDDAQADIRYSARLVETSSRGDVINEYVYPEILSLKNGERITREITYTAPKYLEGKYNLYLYSENSAGLALAFRNLGEVYLAGDKNYVELRACLLTVEGEASNKVYEPMAGTDISPEENILVHCQLVNHFTQDITVTPSFQTTLRSVFGSAVETNQIDQATIDLKASGTKPVTLKMPKALVPQAYEVKLTLLSNDKDVSDNVSIHYVIKGESATIQNVSLDKNSYLNKETAMITLLWSGSADSFPGSRLKATTSSNLFFDIDVRDKNGNECISPIVNEALDKTKMSTRLNQEITSDCQEAQVSATLKDENGKVLDQKTFKFDSPESKPEANMQKNVFGIRGNVLVYLIFIVVTIVSLALIIWNSKKRNISILIFFLFSGFLFLGFASKSQAATYCNEMYGTGGSGEGTCVTVDIKDDYLPNEKLSTDILFKLITCSNSIWKGDIYAALDDWTAWSPSLYHFENENNDTYGDAWCDETLGTELSDDEWLATYCQLEETAKNISSRKVATFSTNVQSSEGSHQVAFQLNLIANVYNEDGTPRYDVDASYMVVEDYKIVTPPAMPIPACPFTATTGSPVFSINTAGMLESDPTSIHLNAVTPTYTKSCISVPAGKYTIQTSAWDGAVGRELLPAQANEQFYVDIKKGTTVLKKVGPTTDIKDGVTQDMQNNGFGTITLAQKADNFKLYHIFYPGNTSNNSVIPICVKFNNEDSFAPACPFSDPLGDSPVVDFNSGLPNDGTAYGLWRGTTNPLEKTVSIPAGTYTVKTLAWDGHPGREYDTPQLAEEFKIDIKNGSNILKTVGPTTDLEDNVAESSKTDTFGPITIGYADNLSLYHLDYPKDLGGGSVIPVCMQFVKDTGLPTVPIITGPTDGITATPYDFTAYSTDPNGKMLKYGFDWDEDGTVDYWTPLAVSGANQTTSHTWPTVGSKEFQVLAQNSDGGTSAWAKHNINIQSCTPVYGSPECLWTPILGVSCTEDDCGKSIIIKTARCVENSTNACTSSNEVDMSLCPSTCVDISVKCAQCAWKEAMP